MGTFVKLSLVGHFREIGSDGSKFEIIGIDGSEFEIIGINS